MRNEQRKVFDASDILRAFKKVLFYEATRDVSELDNHKKSMRLVLNFFKKI